MRELLAVLNASPYHVGKRGERIERMAERAAETGCRWSTHNLVGGQDELVFDGALVRDEADGELAKQLPRVSRKRWSFADVADGAAHRSRPAASRRRASPRRKSMGALVLGVRDYVGKNGFPGVMLGLSGGIDSALVLAVAVDALGADRVRAVMMPSRYTADISWIDAREMAGALGVRYDEISIEPIFEALPGRWPSEFAGLPETPTEENIQARIRGTLLMALSNKFGASC